MPLHVRKNERGVFTALHELDRQRPEDERALLAIRLMGRGYEPMVAGRLALTFGEPFTITLPGEVRR